VNELKEPEVFEYLTIKPDEMGIKFPLNDNVSQQITNVTGGLPLAIQWILGQYKIVGNLERVLQTAYSKDAPILEFSFRNIFNALSGDARYTLMVLSIFDTPPTLQEVSIALDWSIERVTNALNDLREVTLVNPNVSDAKTTFSALPITLNFAKHQFHEMGDLEIECRRRIQNFNAQIELQGVEIGSFSNIFSRFNITSSSEKRAVILCRRAESEIASFNNDSADVLFQQAFEMAATSSYVLATIAKNELNRGRIGLAEDYIKKSINRVNKYTGVYCYLIAAEIYDSQRKRKETLKCLQKAVEYDPQNIILKHRIGVMFSRIGDFDSAILEFNKIIESEINNVNPSKTLLYAIHSRMMTFKRQRKTAQAQADYSLAHELMKKIPLFALEADRFSNLDI
jgi:hypothetical protein